MSGLDKILHVDVWNTLPPATKIVVKILQHIRSKLDDGAEIRAWLDDEDELIITTRKSEVRISKNSVKFKRRAADGSLRVQYVRVELSDEVFKEIREETANILEYDTEPCYEMIVNTLEGYFNRSDEQDETPSDETQVEGEEQ